MVKKALVSLAMVLALMASAQARERVKMILVPFDTEREEYRPLRDGLMDMLGSRLGGREEIELLEKERLTREVTEKIKEELKSGVITKWAEELGLDFIIYGTLRKIGDGVGLEARLLNVKAAAKSLRFFVETETLEGLLPRLGELVSNIREHVLKEEKIKPEVAQVSDLIRKVAVDGNQIIPTGQILALIDSKEGTYFSREKLQRDLMRIGGLKEVADAKAHLRQTEQGVEITFRLQERERPKKVVRVLRIAFVGNQRLPSDVLLAAIRSRVGDLFSEEAISRDLEGLRRLPEIELVNVDLMEVGEGKEVFFIIKEKKAEEKVPALAPPEERIKKIIITGNRVIDAAAIRAVLKSKMGEVFSRDRVVEDIKAIYKLGYFDDVQVEFEETRTGKEITYGVFEKPVIAEIKMVGNKKVSTTDLVAGVGFKVRDVLNPAKVKEGAGKLGRLYEDKGYFAVAVDSQVEELPGKQVRVTYRFQEHEKVFIRDISFKGNKAISAKELKKAITTKERGWFSFFTGSGILNRERLKQDRQLLADHYADRGYIKAAVDEPRVKIDKKEISVTFSIDEGPSFNVGEVKMKGELIVSEEELKKKLKLISGQTFSRDLLRRDIQSLTDFYTDRGFAYANVSPATTVNDEAGRVDVVYDINKSRKVFVERINVSGNLATRDKVIRRQMALDEGDLFSSSALTLSRRRLDSLGYFSKVELTTSEGTSSDKMSVDVKVAEAPTGSISVGAGVSTREGPSVFGEVRQNNFLGRGISLSGRAQLGGESKLFEISTFEPALFDSRFSLRLDLFNTFQEYKDFNRDSLGGAVRFGYPLGGFWGIGFGYRAENVKMSNIPETASLILLAERGTSLISAPYLEFSRDSRDVPMDPSKGSLYRFGTEVAGGLFGGDNDFAKFNLEGNKFFPVTMFKRTAVVMVRGQLGLIEPFAGERVRVLERFFLGGMDTVRGYRTFSIGPRDPATDNVLGGTKSLLFSTELIYPLWEEFNLKGVLFFDAGNAFDSKQSFDPTNLRKSVGAGIKFRTPIGPMRIEYGIALDRLKGDDLGRLEFRFGR